MAPNLGCQDEDFLVVNADDFDNFLVDNHKVVLLTTHLKTFRQPCVLCDEAVTADSVDSFKLKISSTEV